ncbi:MAG: elongation factor G [Dehalococcoidia bacterium]
MNAYAPDDLRNVVLVGHSRAGKTTMAEAALLATGAISRAGRVEDGNTVSDYDEQERSHGYSIAMTPIAIETRGHRINLLDTPGFPDFEGEVAAGAAGAEMGVVVIDAVSGIQPGTEVGWRHLDLAGVRARVFAVTHLDRESTSFARTLAALRARFGSHVVALDIPVAGGHGVLDLSTVEVALDGEAEAEREQLIETAAESSDHLLTEYLEGTPIPAGELHEVVIGAIRSGALIPVIAVSPLDGTGVSALLDLIVDAGPSPLGRAHATDGDPFVTAPDGPAVARVLKTVVDPFIGHLSVVKVVSGRLATNAAMRNVRAGADERASHLFVMRGKDEIEVPALVAGDVGAIPKLAHTATGDVLVEGGARVPALAPMPLPVPTFRSALHPHSKEDVDRLSNALHRLREQDPTLGIDRDPDTGEIIVLTLGDAQAAIAASRLQKNYNIAVDLDLPRVPYRETIAGKADQEYRHKKQTGGHGQFAHVVIRVEPLTPGAGFEFAEQVVGGAVPRQFIPAVEAGVHEAMVNGPLSGSPVVDLRVTLLDGSAHAVDSSEMAFKTAAGHALKEAVLAARPALLEPIMALTIEVPSDILGDLMGDITSRRGSVQSVDSRGDTSVVSALAPLATVQRYASDLRAISHGRGSFRIRFDHYAPLPSNEQERVLAAAAQAR